MNRMLVCIDCGSMVNTKPVEYVAPTENVSGDNQFATDMVVKMGFVYLGCPSCKSPNIFLQPTADSKPVHPPKAKAKVEAEEEEDDDDVDVSDLLVDDDDEDEEDEDEGFADDEEPEPEPPPQPKRKKKKKKKKKRKKVKPVETVKRRNRFGPDGQVISETIKVKEYPDDSGDPDIENLEFKVAQKSPPIRRPKYHRECKTCQRDFVTKHSDIGHCNKCLRRFTGGR